MTVGDFQEESIFINLFPMVIHFLHHDNVLIVRLSHTKTNSGSVPLEHILPLNRNGIAFRPKHYILVCQFFKHVNAK